MAEILEKMKNNLDRIADKLDNGQAANNRSTLDRIADAVVAGSGGGGSSGGGSSDGESSGGGALYLTTSIIDDKSVLSGSYNDILAAVENNKAVFLIESLGLSSGNKGFSVLHSMYTPSQVIPKYSVVFCALDELIPYAADTATEPLVFSEGEDGGDGEQH